MSPLELLAPDTSAAIPFSVRLAERRRTSHAVTARADRRAHLRRSAGDLEWLHTVRLIGGTGYDVKLVDLSEGGALIEVNAPLKPGVSLTLELSGPDLDAAVPLEVLRCYIAKLRGEVATYRGACAFAHLIELPGQRERPAPAAAGAANFVGTDAALKYLLERCTSTGSRNGSAPGASPTGTSGLSLERKGVLHILDALQARTSTRGSDLLSRHTSDLLSSILPALHGGAPRDIVVAALEERLRGLPQRWQPLLQPTSGRLVQLIDHCASTSTATVAEPALENAPATVSSNPPPTDVTLVRRDVLPLEPEPAKSAFQPIVVRQADGKILKGYAQDFHPSRPQFSLWPSINATPKERIVVTVARLKAVFFVKDFNGNPSYHERKAFAGRGQGGRRVEVTFADGEVILGTTLNYRADGQGFFVSPADPSANNTRIFVVSAAARGVRFL